LRGPQYDSDEFQAFAKSFGFKHTRTSPHHPQSNGKAESAVKQAKKILQMTRESGTDYYLALLNIRNTPQEGHNSSPAQRMMNRQPFLPQKTFSNLA
jgi:transposase InsO family protein